jgi:hypothetical protein
MHKSQRQQRTTRLTIPATKSSFRTLCAWRWGPYAKSAGIPISPRVPACSRIIVSTNNLTISIDTLLKFRRESLTTHLPDAYQHRAGQDDEQGPPPVKAHKPLRQLHLGVGRREEGARRDDEVSTGSKWTGLVYESESKGSEKRRKNAELVSRNCTEAKEGEVDKRDASAFCLGLCELYGSDVRWFVIRTYHLLDNQE